MHLSIFQVYINWMNFIVNLMLPLGVLLTLNIAIYKGMQRLRGGGNSSNAKNTPKIGGKVPKNEVEIHVEDEEERERDARFTRASVLMVLAFGLCHTPRLITNTVEMFSDRAHLPHVSSFIR